MESFKHINYDDCITNYTSSIQKYFGMDPNYKTNQLVDKLLNEKNYDNVVTFIFDGMGNNIIDTNTKEDHFLQTHRVGKMKSTFPPTTANCTTSYVTGLNPVTSGWLGWTTYYKDLDLAVDNFPNMNAGTFEIIPGDNLALKRLGCRHLGKEIEEYSNGNVKYYYIMPKFIPGGTRSIDDLFHRVIKICNQPGKKYFYVYWEAPDNIMHCEGTVNKHVKHVLNQIGKGLRDFERKTKNSIGFVSADHGHIDVTPIALYTYYDVMECLRAPLSCDARCAFFFIKEGYEQRFAELFNKYFSDKYDLYTKKEILEKEVFGPGKKHELFEQAIGDYVAVAKDHYYFMYSPKSHNFKGHHAGSLLEEMSIPIICVKS